MYCPRRFALLEVNQDWGENAFVVKANLLHENVHDGRHAFKSTSKVAKSTISLYNDTPNIDIYGVSDCIEFKKSKDGTYIKGLDGNYIVQIVEYKPTQPKDIPFNETDAIQVFAQKLCADFIWNCNSDAYIYYSNTRKRVKLPFDTDYDRYYSTINNLLSEMRNILDTNTIPSKKSNQRCNGCSIEDICMPKHSNTNVKNYILSNLD